MVRLSKELTFDLIQAGTFSQTRSVTSICVDDCPDGDLDKPPKFPIYKDYIFETFASVHKTDQGDAEAFLQFRAVAYSQPDNLKDGELDITSTVTSEMVRWDKSAALGYFAGHEEFTHHKLNILLKTKDAYERCTYTNFRFVLGLGEPMYSLFLVVFIIISWVFLILISGLIVCFCIFVICDGSPLQWARRRIFRSRYGYIDQF